MGKRKLHTGNHYTCDWTGFPLLSAFCYMPVYPANGGKVKKSGAYCNWESVVAHAVHLCNDDEQAFTSDTLAFVREHIKQQIGVVPEPAPHYTELEHMGGRLTMRDFHTRCTYEPGSITYVTIPMDGDIEEGNDPPSSWGADCHNPFRKGKANTNLHVWHNACDKVNITASKIFKCNLHGDVRVVCSTKEQSFMPRTRVVSYTKEEFQAEFVTKKVNKKRKTPEKMEAPFDEEEYGKEKVEMQKQLHDYEAGVSSTSELPSNVKAMKMPPASGKDLARVAMESGMGMGKS